MDAVVTFLIIFGAHIVISFTFKVKILLSLNGHNTLPPIILSFECWMAVIFWARNPISFKIHVFLGSLLNATPNHKLLKYRTPTKKSVIYPYHCSNSEKWNFSEPLVLPLHLISTLNCQASVGMHLHTSRGSLFRYQAPKHRLKPKQLDIQQR